MQLDSLGHLTGRIIERDGELFKSIPSTLHKGGLTRGCDSLSQGDDQEWNYTSVGDALGGPPGPPAYQDVTIQGSGNAHLLLIGAGSNDKRIEWASDGIGNEWVARWRYKNRFADGAVSGDTAGFQLRRFLGMDYGNVPQAKEELMKRTKSLSLLGWANSGTHANGDVAIEDLKYMNAE